MGGKDFRAKPQQDAMSFYVFDDLRFNQNHSGGGNVFRYDTVGEAIEAFRRVGTEHPEWTAALGCNIGGPREVDLVQRRGNDNCLITDYLRLEDFRDNPGALKAIEEAVSELKVTWQVDHELTGSSILVPHELYDSSMDPYFADMVLRPADPGDAATSIQEAFVQGEGWVDLAELCELSSLARSGATDQPKVSRFNVAYANSRGWTGYVDMAPADFRIMRRDYQQMMQERQHERGAARDGHGSEPAQTERKGSWREMIAEAKEAAQAINAQERSEGHRPRDLER